MSNFFQFTLVLDGVDESTPNLEDVLFEAGCDDALINFKNGTVYLDFDREENDLEKAVLSAVKDIESSGLGASISSVAPEHLVSLTDIAKRVSLTKQALSLYMLGKRGGGNFPKPVLKIQNKSPLWLWSAIAEWFYQQGKIKDHSVIDCAHSFDHRREILHKLNKYPKKLSINL